jgi:uncharacterized protein with GYD domain
MPSFVMLTQLSHGSLCSPTALEELERQVMDRISTECPSVEWTGSYVVLGPYDYVDIFKAPDNDVAMKVATIIRTFGHAQTEIWPATEWRAYKDMVRTLPAGEVAA